MKQILPLIAVSICTLSASLSSAEAESESFICSGYNPETKQWGYAGSSPYTNEAGNCPKNHAYISTIKNLGDRPRPEDVTLRGVCCPVPQDLLTQTHVQRTDACPENHIATGASHSGLPERCLRKSGKRLKPECTSLWLEATQYMRCTKINTERYMLGPGNPLKIWGWQPHFSSLLHPKTSKRDMPIAIRYAVGRSGKDTWRREGCVAFPWGSFIVKKSTKYCNGFFSRQLLYRGIEGDPPHGSPVSYLARCKNLENRYSTHPECVK